MNLFQRAAKKLGFSLLVDAANPRERWKRPLEPITVNAIPQEVQLNDWYVLVSDSRKLFCNLGPAKGAICDKATYSVGRAWNAEFTGSNKEWGRKAEKWVNEEWYPMADVRGAPFDFKTDLYITSVATDRDGESYILFTESEDGWPQIQLIPATMIGCRNLNGTILQTGPYKGLRMMQGIIVNKSGRAVAYRVLGATPDEDRDYSARDMIQVFDPEWADQLRGFPVFTHAILDLKDLRTVQGYEKAATALASSIGLIEKNELGAPDPNDPALMLRRGRPSDVNNGAQFPDVVTQDVVGARVMYYRSNSGSGIETLKNDRPGPNWEAFMDRLIRNACVGAGWPFELTWDASKLGGANVRMLVMRAMRSVEDRQDLLRPVARRVVGYAVAKAIKNGILPPNDEWYSWGFGLPARMTVDYGRDGNSVREDYKLGLRNLGEILAEEGKPLAQHIAARAAENEMLKAAGLPIPQPDGQPPPQAPRAAS
jgi:capsid protein